MAIKSVKKLNERHRNMALHVAMGLTVKKAAELVGYDYLWATRVSGSPMFKALVAKYRADIERDTISVAKKRLASEALATVERLIYLRDEGDTHTVQLGASNSLMGHMVPKVAKEEDDRAFHIHITTDHLAHMRASIQEYGDEPLSLAETAEALEDEVRAENGRVYLEDDE